MNLFGGSPSARLGSKAFRLHADGNKLMDIGKRAEAKEKLAQALALYDQAYDQGLDRVNILLAYGILLLREGQFEKAKEVLLKVHYTPNLPPDDRFQLRISYSVCLWRLGMLDEAIETIKRAAQSAKTTGIYTTLGMFLILKAEETGDFSEAIAFNQEAYEYDEEDPAILDNLGLLHADLCNLAKKNGDAETAKAERLKAYDYLSRAHKGKPSQATTLYMLAKLFYEDGDLAQAKKSVDAALACNISAICPVSRETVEALKAKIG